jgi:hypothetical protein
MQMPSQEFFADQFRFPRFSTEFLAKLVEKYFRGVARFALLGYCQHFGGVLASTRSSKRRRHVEDGSLASLKSGPKKINADHQDLALAA